MALLRGVSAAPGVAAGRAVLRPPTSAARLVPLVQRDAEVARAERALLAAAAELTALADRLRSEGRCVEADIVDTGVLMAGDPTLRDGVEQAIHGRGATAADAIVAVTESSAALLAAVDDAILAERAADVRSLGRRAARLAGGVELAGEAYAEVVLIANDLGPADVAEIGADVRAIVLAQGSATAHAAILARSLGIPMVVGLGDQIAAIAPGEPLLVDGAVGAVVVQPDAEQWAASSRRPPVPRSHGLPAETRDGRRIRVRANVAGRPEVTLALAAGAEGVGLLRTELPFLGAQCWPDEAAHRQMLGPVLAGLAGRPVTVRLLDFGADKTPPFLAGSTERGIRLLLASPDALRAQLRAVLGLARPVRLGLLVPMVVEPADVRRVRSFLAEVLAELPAADRPPLGAMVEVPAAVAMIDSLVREVDFLSIGTNDLSRFQLGVTDRTALDSAPVHHPAVLKLLAATIDAAQAAGRPVGVCGEAASDRVALPLLLGLGIGELSVGAARVATVRSWVRALDTSVLAEIAGRALRATSAGQVETIVRPVADLLVEGGDAADERFDRGSGVVPFGHDPQR